MTVGTNVKDWWKVVVEFSKQNSRFIMWITLFSVIALLTSQKILIYFGFSPLPQYIGLIIVFVLLGSVSLLFINSIDSVGFRVFDKNYLKCLAEDEKQVLRYFLIRGNKSQLIRVIDGGIDSLVKHRILQQGTSIIYESNPLETMKEYIITDWAWKYLKKRPNLIDVKKGIEETFPVD